LGLGVQVGYSGKLGLVLANKMTRVVFKIIMWGTILLKPSTNN